MSLPTSRGAFGDCYKVLDAALDDEKGVRVEFRTHENANYFRMRLHQARAINRKDNADTYDRDHPLYNASPYDQLVVRLHAINGSYWLYIEKNRVEDLGAIEPLSEVPTIEYDEPLQLQDMREADDGPTYEAAIDPDPVPKISRRSFR